MDQGQRKRNFRLQRRQQQQQSGRVRPAGVRPLANVRHTTANARTNYERYTMLAKDAARRGESVEAENFYQHAEHYYRMMRDEH